jgi:transposase
LDAQQRIVELQTELAVAHARIAEQEARIIALTKQVEVLLERLGQNSRNSNKPPSSDPTGAGPQRKPNQEGEKRERGGQRGHRGAFRELLPASEVDEVVNLFPPQCESCWTALPENLDPEALRYQVSEVPPIKPHTKEFRRHEVQCACGYRTRAAYDPATIPASRFGPRLVALTALLTGVYHISRRRTGQLLEDVLGVRLSVGAITGG